MDLEDKILIEDEGDRAIKETVKTDPIVITDPATDRYNTFGFISWWKQDVVRNATVMVVGAGALGNEVIKNLVLMGIGRILIVDFDTIEDSNLSRSILFRASDNGRKKAEVAAEAAREINPDVAVQWIHGDINYNIGLGVFRRMDVVIGCLDNREARLAINKACWHLNKPWVDGAIQELLGIARVFRPNDGACYECTLTDEDYRIINVRISCQLLAHQNVVQGKVPTTPTIASIIGSIQTQEALKLLHGMETKSGEALVFNGLTNDVFNMEYAERTDCPSHWIYDGIIELKQATSEGTTLKELLIIARDELGQDVMLQIPAFATKAICSHCGCEKDLFCPRHKLTFEDIYCTKCGNLTEIVTFERVRGDEIFLDFTLSRIGVPPLSVVSARTNDWQFKHFELSRDKKAFFDFTKFDVKSIDTHYE